MGHALDSTADTFEMFEFMNDKAIFKHFRCGTRAPLSPKFALPERVSDFKLVVRVH